MGIFRDLLLVLAIIALTYSYTTDRSMKSLIDNPPEEIAEFFQSGSDVVVNTTDTAADVAGRLVDAANEQADDLDSIEQSVNEALETTSRIEEAIDNVEVPDAVEETVNNQKSRIEQATE